MRLTENQIKCIYAAVINGKVLNSKSFDLKQNKKYNGYFHQVTIHKLLKEGFLKPSNWFGQFLPTDLAICYINNNFCNIEQTSNGDIDVIG